MRWLTEADDAAEGLQASSRPAAELLHQDPQGLASKSSAPLKTKELEATGTQANQTPATPTPTAMSPTPPSRTPPNPPEGQISSNVGDEIPQTEEENPYAEMAPMRFFV